MNSVCNAHRMLALIVTVALVNPNAQAAPDIKLLDDLRRVAQIAEANQQWARACKLYDHLLSADRDQSAIRERYLICFRHADLVQRLRDASFQQIVGRDIHFALKIYGEIVTKLQANYLRRDKTDFGKLFQSGLDQLNFALSDDAFRRERLPSAIRLKAVRAFQRRLREEWRQQEIPNLKEAQARIVEVALEARRALDLNPSVTVLEMACGACNGLDEYTLYLTPTQVTEEFASLEGELIGVGIEVVVRDGHAMIAQVLMNSPAGINGIRQGDGLVRIDRKPVDNLGEEVIGERLKGAAGTIVELDIVPFGEMQPRTVSLTRQILRVPSIMQTQMLPPPAEGIGYFRVSNFQKTTPQELDDALLDLRMQGMRVLILDLRGNQGGVFGSAIQVAERFLAKGKTIVRTRSDVADRNHRYVSNFADALNTPLVLLVDGDTASAAEVVASALQENGRALLVGQRTYGKWSVQRVLQLEATGAGVRVTLARFLSPDNKSHQAKGIVPDRLVERGLSTMRDVQLDMAVEAAKDLAFMQRQ